MKTNFRLYGVVGAAFAFLALGIPSVSGETHAEAIERAVRNWSTPFGKTRTISPGLHAQCVDWGDMSILIDASTDEKQLRSILTDMHAPRYRPQGSTWSFVGTAASPD